MPRRLRPSSAAGSRSYPRPVVDHVRVVSPVAERHRDGPVRLSRAGSRPRPRSRVVARRQPRRGRRWRVSAAAPACRADRHDIVPRRSWSKRLRQFLKPAVGGVATRRGWSDPLPEHDGQGIRSRLATSSGGPTGVATPGLAVTIFGLSAAVLGPRIRRSGPCCQTGSNAVGILLRAAPEVLDDGEQNRAPGGLVEHAATRSPTAVRPSWRGRIVGLDRARGPVDGARVTPGFERMGERQMPVRPRIAVSST